MLQEISSIAASAGGIRQSRKTIRVYGDVTNYIRLGSRVGYRSRGRTPRISGVEAHLDDTDVTTLAHRRIRCWSHHSQ